MELQVWLYFLLTTIVLAFTPGPAVLLVTTQGLKYGVKPSWYGALGISAGNLMYFILSALGLSALILAAGNVFDYVKIAGAAYLIYAGLRMVYNSYRKKDNAETGTEEVQPKSSGAFLQAFITQAANPKAIIFFVALLPQFIDQSKDTGLQFFILGTTTIIPETFILMLYGWLGSKGRILAAKYKKFDAYRDRFAGLVLVFLGIRLLFIKQNSL